MGGSFSSGREFKFVIIGETGAGKSSFLDYLCNLPELQKERAKRKLGLPAFDGWHQKQFRKAVNEFAGAGQRDSKTSAASEYHIHGFGHGFMAIDTPGLGDSRGKLKDDSHIQSIEETIMNQDYINAICLVINGKCPRATPQIEYVLTRLSTFVSKRIMNQIVVIFTHTESWDFLEFDTDLFAKLLEKTVPEEHMFCFDNPYACIDLVEAAHAKKGKGKGADAKSIRMIKERFAESMDEIEQFFQTIRNFEPVEIPCFKKLFEAKSAVEAETIALNEKLISISKQKVAIEDHKRALSSAQVLKDLLAQLKVLSDQEDLIKARLQAALSEFKKNSTESSFARVINKQKDFIMVLIEHKSNDLKVSEAERVAVIQTLREQIKLLDIQKDVLKSAGGVEEQRAIRESEAQRYIKEFTVTRDDYDAVWTSTKQSIGKNPCITIVRQGKAARTLGMGGQGTVVTAEIHPHEEQQTMQVVAAKGAHNILDHPSCQEQKNRDEFLKFTARFDREVRAYRDLEHPNLIGLKGIAYENIEVKEKKTNGVVHPGFDIRVPVWILTEYDENGRSMRAELTSRRDKLELDALASQNVPYAKENVEYAKQVLQGLSYMHRNGYVHCDISSANVVIYPGPTIKLIDFGVTHRKDEKGTITEKDTCRMCQPPYMCPEGASIPERPSRDMFAFGTMLFEMMTLKDAEHCRPTHPRRAVLPQFGTPVLHEVALKCINQVSFERPDAEDALKDLRVDCS